MPSSPGEDDLLDFFSARHIRSAVMGIVSNSTSSLLAGMTSSTQCGRHAYVPSAGLAKKIGKVCKGFSR